MYMQAISPPQVACIHQQMAQHVQLLVQTTVLAFNGRKQNLAGYLSCLLNQMHAFVGRQIQTRQASLQQPWNPVDLGLCSGPDWLKGDHNVVICFEVQRELYVWTPACMSQPVTARAVHNEALRWNLWLNDSSCKMLGPIHFAIRISSERVLVLPF